MLTFFLFKRLFTDLNLYAMIFTPFCRSRRADSIYIYFIGVYKVFFTIIGRWWKKSEDCTEDRLKHNFLDKHAT